MKISNFVIYTTFKHPILFPQIYIKYISKFAHQGKEECTNKELHESLVNKHWDMRATASMLASNHTRLSFCRNSEANARERLDPGQK